MNTEMEQACCKYCKALAAMAKAMAKIKQGKIRLAETTLKAEAKISKANITSCLKKTGSFYLLPGRPLPK